MDICPSGLPTAELATPLPTLQGLHDLEPFNLYENEIALVKFELRLTSKCGSFLFCIIYQMTIDSCSTQAHLIEVFKCPCLSFSIFNSPNVANALVQVRVEGRLRISGKEAYVQLKDGFGPI